MNAAVCPCWRPVPQRRRVDHVPAPKEMPFGNSGKRTDATNGGAIAPARALRSLFVASLAPLVLQLARAQEHGLAAQLALSLIHI